MRKKSVCLIVEVPFDAENRKLLTPDERRTLFEAANKQPVFLAREPVWQSRISPYIRSRDVGDKDLESFLKRWKRVYFVSLAKGQTLETKWARMK